MKQKAASVFVCIFTLMTFIFGGPLLGEAATNSEPSALAESIAKYYEETWNGSGLSVAVFNTETELYETTEKV